MAPAVTAVMAESAGALPPLKKPATAVVFAR